MPATVYTNQAVTVATPADLQAVDAALQTSLTALAARVAALESVAPTVPVMVYGGAVGAELVQSLPITTGQPFAYRVVLSQHVTDIKAGDVFLVLSDIQVSQELFYTVMVGTMMLFASSSSSVTGAVIATANTKNIDRDEHHYPRNRWAVWTAPQDMSSGHFNLVAYAASTAAQPNDQLVVDPSDGRLTVMRFRPSAAVTALWA